MHVLPRLAALPLVAALATQPGFAQAHSAPAGVAPALIERVAYPKPQAPQSSDSAPTAEDQPDPAVAQSIGCVLAGTLGTGVALSAGGENVVNIVAGGLVTPINQIALYTALVGVVFGTFCSVGQAVTPLYLHVMKPPTKKGPEELSCPLPKLSSTDMRPAEALLIRASQVQVMESGQSGVDMSAPENFRRRK